MLFAAVRESGCVKVFGHGLMSYLSAFGGRADVICSERVFPVLTQVGS